MNHAEFLTRWTVRDRPVRFTRILAIVALTVAAPLQGQQQPIVIVGRIVEQGTGQAISGATVELVGVATRLSGDDGLFRIADIEPGRHVLRVTALGYRSAESSFTAVRDTSVLIELAVVPVALDTMQVASRTMTVRGTVKDAETGVGLIDVEVAVLPNHEGVTDPIGRYKLERVPAGPPLAMTVQGFGYLPIVVRFEAERDTTMDFQLEVDPIVQQMIAEQVERLEARADPFFTAGMPSITRTDLMRRINWNVLDIVKDRFGRRLGRVQCLIIDEVESHRGIGELALMLPDRIERIELLYRGAMLRLYTRDFMRRMSGGAITLRKPYVAPGLCT